MTIDVRDARIRLARSIVQGLRRELARRLPPNIQQFGVETDDRGHVAIVLGDGESNVTFIVKLVQVR